ncbi:MAG: DUF4013 domain-containing protein [Haloplanus sp.]
MTDLDSTLHRPLETDGWAHTVLVGTLLVVTMPVVVPGVLLAGYAVRLLRTDPDDPLPDFTAPRSLAETGVRAAGIVAVYHAPVLLAGVAGVTSAITLVHDGSVATLRPLVFSAPTLRTTLPVALAVVGAATVPVSGYLSTIGVTAYAATDRLGAAFDPVRIRRRAWSKTTFVAWMFGVLVTVAGGIVAFLVGSVTATMPGVGGLIVGAVRFYAGTVALHVWKARRPADGDETPEATTAGRATDADPA